MEIIVDALYSRLLLRDFFAKIVPGLMIWIALYFAVTPNRSVTEFVYDINEFSIVITLFLLGTSWLVGFAIQLIRERRPNTEVEARRFARLVEFRNINTPTIGRHLQQHERFAVVAEACGNGAIGSLLSMLLYTFVAWAMCPKCNCEFTLLALPIWGFVSTYVIVIGFGVALWWMSNRNWERQEAYLGEVLENQVA